MIAQSRALVVGMMIAVVMTSALNASAAEYVPGWNEVDVARFDYWVGQLQLPPAVSGELVIGRTISSSGSHREDAAVSVPAIHGARLSGAVRLNGPESLIRVLLVDTSGKEYLAYESYSYILSSSNYSLTQVCEETCFLEGVQISSLRVELINASITIDRILYSGTPTNLPGGLGGVQTRIKTVQNAARIAAINRKIAELGMKWTAGETHISTMPYADRKKALGILPVDSVINREGAEYYRGGVYQSLSERVRSTSGLSSPITTTSLLPKHFDWRERHGATNPASSYYDGDARGSGWLTSNKNQGGCGSCWSFGSTGAVEALTNLYFNQHLDLDLAEQDLLSCSFGGSCSGGWPSIALDYVRRIGIVDEACFPYTASDVSCANRCANPSESIHIRGARALPSDGTEEDLKREILQSGPLSGAVLSWGHAMTLVGYEVDVTDGRVAWLFKNSWGQDWGENGYVKLKTSIGDILYRWFQGVQTLAIETPIESTVNRFDIRCTDQDGDGFYNWGISADVPASCPAGIPSLKDCDDASRDLGPANPNFYCQVLRGGPNTVASLVGDKDSYHGGDTVDVPPRSDRVRSMLSFMDNIRSIVGQNLSADLDVPGVNRPVGFTHMFYLPPQAIATGAKVRVRIRGAELVKNDAILFNESSSPSESDGACTQSPPADNCTPKSFFPLIALRHLLGREPIAGEDLTLELNLERVPVMTGGQFGPGDSWPASPSGYRNLLPLLKQGRLDLVLADDVEVDYSSLEISYVVASEIAGDFIGDGCVDRRDLDVLLGEIRRLEPRNPVFDLNGDGRVNAADARALAVRFTRPLGASCH